MQNSSENFKPFWRMRFGRRSVVRPPSNGEGFKNIQHIMSLILNTRFYIWFIMTVYYKMRQILLQNATATLLQNTTEGYYKLSQVFYYKMRQFYYKMRQLLQIATILLQNATATLLQNTTEGYYKLRQVFYHKMRQFYYKMRQLLQIATILSQNATVVTKYDIYYKLRQYKPYKQKKIYNILSHSITFGLQKPWF